MELTQPYQNTLKINGKKGYVLFNPQAAEDAKIIILDDQGDPSQFSDDTLCVYGPGEFEAGGIVVKGTRTEGSTMYEIENGEGRALHVLSDSVGKLSDEEDFDVVIIKAITPIEEAQLTSLSSGIIVVYGDVVNIPDKVKESKVSKVLIRKKEELPSNIVYLEKK